MKGPLEPWHLSAHLAFMGSVFVGGPPQARGADCRQQGGLPCPQFSGAARLGGLLMNCRGEIFGMNVRLLKMSPEARNVTECVSQPGWNMNAGF